MKKKCSKRGRKIKSDNPLPQIAALNIISPVDTLASLTEEQTEVKDAEHYMTEEETVEVPEIIINEADNIFKPRMSDISVLLAETNKMKKVNAGAKKNPLLSATRSSARNCKPNIYSGTMPAPSTTRPIRNKKMTEGIAFVTPAGQRLMPHAVGAGLLVTPKFDPRVPLPPGTIRRRPLPDEIPMSLTGSPLRISPLKPNLKEIMSSLYNTLEKEVPQIGVGDLQQIHAVLDRFIDERPSDP